MVKRAVITGASGFIGANLARRLIREGYETHLLLRANHKTWRIQEILKQVHPHTVNLVDREKIGKVFKKIRPHSIFHLAAHGAYSWQDKFEPILQTNVLATYHLLDAALKTGFESFIQVGSSSEYGFTDHPPSEKERIDPNSYYALTKSCATMLARYVALSQKANVVILRPYNVYGPYEEPARFIPTLIVKGLEGKLPALVSPFVARDYLYVDDFVDACLLAARQAKNHIGEIYNVGTGVQTTIQDAVQLAKKILPIKSAPRWGSMPNRIWDTRVWVSNSQKIRKQLGWKPRYSFKAGFEAMAGWLKASPPTLRFYKKSICSS